MTKMSIGAADGAQPETKLQRKSRRHKAIIKLLEEYPISSQEELTAKLNELGFGVAQTTVCRDIKELGIARVAVAGNYRYRVSKINDINARFARIFSDAAHSVACARNLVIIKSLAGMGSAIGVAVDGMQLPDVVGTLAGDDTLLIITKDDQSATELCETFKGYIKTE